MATLVFDIETVGERWSEIDETTQEMLTSWIDRTSKDDIERSIQLDTLKNQLGFSPLTGHIVSLAMYDVERSLGAVYFVGNGSSEQFTDDSFTYKERSEKEILEDFWEGARSYDTFVTFNGRSFDVPFILHRSVALHIKPSIEFSNRRYLTQQSMPYHVDLQDELTFYGAMNRRPSLHLFCRTYGIKSPKGEMSGYEVAEFFRQKKFRDIAHYNARDVIATTKLYEKWKQYLAPASFLNTIDF